MKALVLILVFCTALMAELQVFAGLSMGYGEPVVNQKMYDPHGRFGVRYVTEYLEAEVSHLSAIPNPLDEWGINMVGANLTTPEYKGFSGFAGYARNLTSGIDYVGQFDGNLYKTGIRYNLGNQRLFIEGLKSDKTSIGSFGIEWLF